MWLMSRAEGEGWKRVRQSGRLSGVWTCLEASTRQRKSLLHPSPMESGPFEHKLAPHRRVRSRGCLFSGLLTRFELKRSNPGLGGVTPCTQRCLPTPPPLADGAATFYAQKSTLSLFYINPRPGGGISQCFGVCFLAAAPLASRHCSLCLKKPCFLLPRMTSRSARPIGRPQ